jgi:acetyl-CoA C-acetyltransferase
VNERTPVIIGVGQAIQREAELAVAKEPAQLMADAVATAFDDAHLARTTAVDLMTVVALMSWKHGDAARLIEADLGLSVRGTAVTTHGGNTPQSLVNTYCQMIADGQLELGVITGGECSRTKAKAKRADHTLTWRKTGTEPDQVIGVQEPMFIEPESRLGLFMPVQHYPMFESALRHRLGRSVDDHQVAISELWARFSQVAATNPFAWSQTPQSAEEIRTVSQSNRMIGLPYPKQMNSNNDVDQAAAVIICSAAKAEALGVPRSQWVFPQVGADAHETYAVSHRPTLSGAPAVGIAGRHALDHVGLSPDDIDLVDLYSCFPVAVQIGAAELSFSLDRQLTRTGGLPFAGGPWNNYVMHAIATVVTDLRAGTGQQALVWANGGYLTKHAIGIYGLQPAEQGWAHLDPQAEVEQMKSVDVAIDAGDGAIEAYTVMHDRTGQPERAFASVRDSGGTRRWGTSQDSAVMAALGEGDQVGLTAFTNSDGELTLR